ncbi:MAG TPA: energy transducer TonB [Thermoanaerobaculia bacterium]|nr:energy transducer TonB [Thermoanaerobaculia bacterium]
MDTVGEIIWERGKERFPLGVGTFLAIVLHVSVAAAFIYSSMIHPVSFVSPRTVAVRLLPAGSLKGGEAPAPAPAPPPDTKKILKPAPEDEPPPPTDKAVLLPGKEDKKKPATPSRPATERPRAPDVSLPSSGESSGGGSGGAVGAGGSVGVSGAAFDSDFQFSYYVERMLVAIGMNWFKPSQAGSISPVIHFRIEKDGTISDASIERSSGLPFVDRAALRAVLSSSPLPPLPAEYSGSQLGVHLKFD